MSREDFLTKRLAERGEELERLRAALILIADKDKSPIYSVDDEVGTSKQIGWAYGTCGQLANRALAGTR